MSSLEDFADKLLSDVKYELKAEFDQIPQSVKDALPRAGYLIAKSTLGALNHNEEMDLKHALSLTANVRVGGRIALNELLLNKAEDILTGGIDLIRRLVGI